MYLYMVTLGWDADKSNFIVAKDEDQARKMINKIIYWMPEYYDDWIIYQIPTFALSLYNSACSINTVPSIEQQAKINDCELE